MASFASKKDESFRAYALTASPWRVLLTVCAPLALYEGLHMIFKILDTLMASHIGSDEVSAIAAISQISLMITAIGSGLATGGCIKISEAYGRGDYELVRKRVATVYIMAVIVSLAVAATLIPFAEGFLRLLNTSEHMIQIGAGYFRVEILTLVVSFFNTVYIAIERSRGHAKKILVMNVVIFVAKLALSALFVYVLNYGVMMIAVATLISQLLLLVYALSTMPRDEGAFRFSFRNICLKKQMTWPIVNLAYPVSAEKMLFAGGKVIVNAMSDVYGDLTVGALGISNNIGGLTTGFHAGMFSGASSLISQNRGAGKYKRTLQLFYCLTAINMGIGLAGLLWVTPTLPWLAEVFARSKDAFDPVFCQMIVSIHQWEMLGYITLGLNSSVLALLLGYGYTKLTLILNVARVFVFRVPVLWAFQNFTSMGHEAVGLTMMISNICAGLSALLVAIPVVMKIRRKAKEKLEEETL